MLLSVSILLYIFGSLISYQILICSMVKYSVKQFGMDPVFINSNEFSCFLSIPVCLLILFPMSLMRDLSAMRYVSLASLGALLYTVIVLLAEFPSYYRYFSTVSLDRPYYIDLNLFTGCSMVYFSYNCQIQILPIYNEL